MSSFKRLPTPIVEIEKDICRVLPLYIADNFDYFDIMAVPRRVPKNWGSYLLKFRKDLACIKHQMEV